VHRQIDEDVDAVGTDHFAEVRIFSGARPRHTSA